MPTHMRAQAVDIVILNERGLHARASAKFVQLAEQFDANIMVAKGGERVLATSIMGLMMLGANCGSTISVSAEGPEAKAALAALCRLVGDKFDEE